MNIGILGSGIVGLTLANGFLKHGHTVMVGTRTPDKHQEIKEKTHNKATTGSFAEAAQFGEILVLAVKGSGALEALKLVGEAALSNKTIIDTTNPIADAPPINGVLRFFTSFDKSLMEELQASFPKAHFVKAFNSIGNAFMVNPDFKDRPTMFICGNNADSKREVSKILYTFGFEVEDMGMVEAARAIEPLCMLWCIPGLLRNEWNHAFRLLKK